MSWPVAFDTDRIRLHVDGRISLADAARQEATVRAILTRLRKQPGVILADEVGMGKTFVALAVAVSVAWADRKHRPVVVMVPSSLKDKWPNDFDTFFARCLRREEDRCEQRLRARRARNGVEFFRLLDDPAPQRAHIIFLTHGALHGALVDPFVKLAILQHALRPARFAARRRALPRFAGGILHGAKKYPESLFEQLLGRSPRYWRSILAESGDDPGDDPVPYAIAKVLKRNRVNLKELREKLVDLPLKTSIHIDDRLSAVRKALNKTIQDIWGQALVQAQLRSPLLILDEAHHLKNPATRLASLFVEPEADEEARLLTGALSGAFERMLFLTATPFQLGHQELLSVLDRFRGIRWQPGSPSMSREDFDQSRKQLASVLQGTYLASSRLDVRWGQIRHEDLNEGGAFVEPSPSWWASVCSNPAERPERVQLAHRAYEAAREAMREAEKALRPWVIRHLRSRKFEGSDTDRRLLLLGDAIRSDGNLSGDPGGIAVRDDALLPFLLAARSQALLAGRPTAVQDRAARRATFAEGLASSYEAFLETRAATLRERSGDTLADEDGRVDLVPAESPAGSNLRWYLKRLGAALPSPEDYARHPKIELTVSRASDLWEQGEKVLVFCHYRATGTALASHISAEIEARIRHRAASAMGCPIERVAHELDLLSERFEPDRPLYAALRETVNDLLSSHASLASEEREEIFEVVRRFVRTPSFLVRFFPIGEHDINAAFRQALGKEDGSGLSLIQRLRGFVDFLSNRCEPTVRAEYLAALRSMRTGIRYGRKHSSEDDADPIALQPTVRRATGEDGDEERRRSLLGFNTPFFPEVLVASSVLAEGVDLHLDCRHVIHHDLCWNPSTLEQRTGRIDRIGAKAERVGKSIHVYLPYIAETQDEKMFRVVRDRERWFQILMGEDYTVDESITDRTALRIPLPESAASELAFHLEVFGNRGDGIS